MLTLAIEQSTPHCSLALLEGGRPRAERDWRAQRRGGPGLMDFLPGALAHAGVRIEAVELFAVSLGPGSYSGLRTALAAARALALPGDRPVRGVKSAAALASDAALEMGAGPVAVVGDARRGRLWTAVFDAAGDTLRELAACTLTAAEDLGAALERARAVASPDWDRLGDLLRRRTPPGARLLERPAFPRARTVGRLALASLAAGEPPLPPTLLYLHPPVFVPPRFPPPGGTPP